VKHSIIMPEPTPDNTSPQDPLSGDEFAHHDEQVRAADWQPPRGPLTKLVAWVILVGIAVCVIGMIVILIADAVR
jgi:hypothetical protein